MSRGWGTPFLLVALFGNTGPGCKGDPARALVPVDISAALELTDIHDVEVIVTSGAKEVATKTFAWNVTAGQTLKVGVYVPGSVDGTVGVQAFALDVNGTQVGASPKQNVVVHARQTAAVVTLVIAAGVPVDPDGGAGAGGDGSITSDASDTGSTGDGHPGVDAAAGASGDASGDAAMEASPEALPDASPDTPPPNYVWGAAVNIEKDFVTSSYWPRVAIDPTSGDVLVVWTEGSAAAVRRYAAAAGTWSATKILDNRGDVQDMTVAMGAGGHALVVWRQYDDGTLPAALLGVWGVHSEDRGATWSAPARIHAGPAWGDIALGISSAGNAKIAWDEIVGGIRSLWTAAYQAATASWIVQTQVKLGSDPYERHARIAMTPLGSGILVWIQHDAMNQDSVWGWAFTDPAGPPMAELLETYTADSVFGPVVAISPDGTRGVVTWDQNGTPVGELWINEYVAATGWKGAKRVLSADVGAPAVAIDRSSTVTLAWTQPLVSGKWNMMAMRYPHGGAFGTPTALETTNQAPGRTDEYPYGEVQADKAGNVHVLWRRKINATGNTFGVFVRSYAASTSTWQPEQMLSVKTGLRAIDPHLAVAEDGRAAAVFYYSDPDSTNDADAYNIFAALFK